MPQLVEHILHTTEVALGSRADVSPAVLGPWLETRRRELSQGELVYVAHPLDFVGRRA